ncbi:hypothetical protein Tco_1136494 [Tanacetum coccineum]
MSLLSCEKSYDDRTSGTHLILDSYTSGTCIQSWGISSYARALIEIQADVKLKDTIVVAILKQTRVGFYTCIVRVEYEWKPPRCACCKVFGHVQEECPKNPGLGAIKNLKKPSHTYRGVPVGPKLGFNPAKEYRLVAKKPTANTSGNNKKDVEPTKEVSNSNPFVVLNLVLNDEDNINTTLIVEKIGKLEQLIIDGIGTLFDDDGKPLKRVDYPDDHDSDDEVCSIDNDMDRSMATKTIGFGTQSQDLPDKLQDICNNLDIRVRG